MVSNPRAEPPDKRMRVLVPRKLALGLCLLALDGDAGLLTAEVVEHVNEQRPPAGALVARVLAHHRD
jgi:hypothetical protein